MTAASDPGRDYRTINPTEVIATAELLAARINDRFPGAGLYKVSQTVVALSREIGVDAQTMQAPILWVRILRVVTILAGLLVIGVVLTKLSFDRIDAGAIDIVQGIEAGLNTILIVGLGTITLFQMEVRIKRREVFRRLHELRSIIHVIDMHQLTKDPAALSGSFSPSAHSPRRTLTAPDLSRYLDYCSELLSITGKLAAIYAQSVDDDVVVRAVNDVESLGSNLSRKIWQKIMMIAEETGARRRGG
jgi:hypothetical protein